MFAVGISEPLDAPNLNLVRHSLVWVGDPSGETSRGLPANHPVCSVLHELLRRFQFVGSWLIGRELSSMRKFEQQALRLKLEKHRFAVDQGQTQFVRASKGVGVEAPWPFGPDSALPWPQSEVLIIGRPAGFELIPCLDERTLAGLRSIRGEALILHSELAALLSTDMCLGVSIGRTHAENSPGLSIIVPVEQIEPLSLVGDYGVAGVHNGADAGRAWSYRRVIQ